MGYAPLVYKTDGGDTLVVANGGKVKIESGGTLSLEAGAVADITDKLLAGGDIAVADGKILVGDSNGKGAAVTPSGDVTITNAGVTAIGAGKVLGSMLASGAGVASLLTAGLGASASYLKNKANTTDLLAGHLTKERAVLIVVVVDETLAAAGGTEPTFSVGEESGAVDKFVSVASLATKTAGTVQVYGGTQSANKKIQVTGTTFVGAGTGGITVTVIGIPTT